MLKTFKRIITFTCLVGSTFSSAWAENAIFDFSVTPIADNVYSIVSPSFGLPTPENKGWNSNSHFVVTDKGVLLFDTGSSEIIGNEIKKAIKSVTQKPVRWVVNSHSHADHWLGNAGFSDTGAEIIASARAVTIMKEDGQGPVDAFSRMTKGATGSTHIVYPTLLLTQGEKRNFGGVDVEFIFSNDAHSPGDLLMWLPKQKILIGGDVLSSQWMPILTYHGNVPHLIDTLYSVVKLQPDIVLTGHGEATTAKSIKRDADLVAGVWKRVKEGHQDDKKPNEIILAVSDELGPKYRPLYQNFDSEIKRHVELMYKRQQ